uniref:Transposase n=1 Tax=Ascaris lumbricoides TaxID=6252 RepID=A0A0M3IUQ0_ASCLU
MRFATENIREIRRQVYLKAIKRHMLLSCVVVLLKIRRYQHFCALDLLHSYIVMRSSL